eukprot:6196725-Pleurochrysis_carterae.AAC.2
MPTARRRPTGSRTSYKPTGRLSAPLTVSSLASQVDVLETQWVALERFTRDCDDFEQLCAVRSAEGRVSRLRTQ